CKKNNDFLGLYYIKLASQALKRTDHDGKSPAVKIGYCLGSGVMNLTNAAIGTGVATLTFGASSLAAIQPLVGAGRDFLKAGAIAYKTVKNEYDKQDWYQGLHMLQALCWMDAIDAMEDNKKLGKFISLMDDLKTLVTDKKVDSEAINITKYALTDTLARI